MSKLISSEKPTVIFAEWDPESPMIVVRIMNKALDLPEWQALRDSFDKLPRPSAQGSRTADDRVLTITFPGGPPPVEFVKHCLALIQQQMEFRGFPDHFKKWVTSGLEMNPEHFADPESVREHDQGDALRISSPEDMSNKTPGELLRLGKDAIISDVGRGELGHREAYAALIKVIEAVEALLQ